jgi:peptidoglycan/LPS O-acetylase OafA/YrhL
MAVLREDDLRKILGDDYLELQAQARRDSGLRDEQLLAKSRIENLENSRFSGFALALIGVALFITGYFGAKGQELMIEDIVAGVLLLAGVGLMAYAVSRIKPLRAVLAQA